MADNKEIDDILKEVRARKERLDNGDNPFADEVKPEVKDEEVTINIAEGAARSSDVDFAHFLDFALGSAFEVETQLRIAKNVGYFDDVDLNANLDVNVDVDKRGVTYEVLRDKIHSIERQLNGLINSIRNS